MSGSRRKALRKQFTAIVGKAPTKREMRLLKKAYVRGAR